MSVFHDGELKVQDALGVKDAVAAPAARVIRDYMPDQHRQFFEGQSMILTSFIDAEGHPWASPIFGKPGFVRSPDPKILRFKGRAIIEKSGQAEIALGGKVGVLGIEFGTRRRNRINGVVTEIGDDGFTIHVDQSFGNCPQYIQKRHLAFDSVMTDKSIAFQSIDHDSSDLISLVETADTFFIASRSAELTADPRSGVDVSHRGGRPGFIRFTGEDRLIFPDFSGNRFFNTLGNIVSDSRVGLFIPDFVKGGGVWLKGEARIIWDPTDIGAFKGAERFIEIKISTLLIAKHDALLNLSTVEPWPRLSLTGVWSDLK